MSKLPNPQIIEGWATSHLLLAAAITFAVGLFIGAVLF